MGRESNHLAGGAVPSDGLMEGQIVHPKGRFLGPITPDVVWARKGLSFGAKAMYGVLASCAKAGDPIFPSYTTLGRKLGVTSRSAAHYCRELRDASLLRIITHGHKGRTNRFEFIFREWLRPSLRRVDKGEPSVAANSQEECIPSHEQNPSTDTGRIVPETQERSFLQNQLREPIKRTTKENAQQQQKRAVEVCDFPKSLNALRIAFPSTEAHHSCINECRESGFSDDKIAKWLNLFGSGPGHLAPYAETPVPLVREAIAKLRQ